MAGAGRRRRRFPRVTAAGRSVRRRRLRSSRIQPPGGLRERRPRGRHNFRNDEASGSSRVCRSGARRRLRRRFHPHRRWRAADGGRNVRQSRRRRRAPTISGDERQHEIASVELRRVCRCDERAMRIGLTTTLSRVVSMSRGDAPRASTSATTFGAFAQSVRGRSKRGSLPRVRAARQDGYVDIGAAPSAQRQLSSASWVSPTISADRAKNRRLGAADALRSVSMRPSGRAPNMRKLKAPERLVGLIQTAVVSRGTRPIQSPTPSQGDGRMCSLNSSPIQNRRIGRTGAS